MIRSRAPVRIDFAGGWTDIQPFCSDYGGFVVNATINRFAHTMVTPNENELVELSSFDTKDFEQAISIRDLEYNGTLDLIKAALKICTPNLRTGINISVRSDAPPGSGIGTSSAVAVAALASIAHQTGIIMNDVNLAETAYKLESNELDIPCGKQDQYASALGGFSALEFIGSDVQATKLTLPRNRVLELEERFILCYTGKSRLSGKNVARVISRYRNNDQIIKRSLIDLKLIAKEFNDALKMGTYEEIGALIKANWQRQTSLDTDITTKDIEKVIAIGKAHNALGYKACGAGGGGCVLLLSESGKEGPLRTALSENGFNVLHFSFQDSGVTVWQV